MLKKMDSDYGTHQVEFEKHFEREANIEWAYRLMREPIRRMGGDYSRAYSLDRRLGISALDCDGRPSKETTQRSLYIYIWNGSSRACKSLAKWKDSDP